MANAVADGAREVAVSAVDVKRVPETVPADVSSPQAARRTSLLQPAELENYDAIIFGTPTRFGNMSGQMRNFLDQTGALWMNGSLVGKVGSVFTSTATQHGGQEGTILTTHVILLHHGMILVGLPYADQRKTGTGRDQGWQPLRCGHIAGGQGERMPSAQELGMARYQGKHVAAIAAKLFG